MEHSSDSADADVLSDQPRYFNHSTGSHWMVMHVSCMIVAWAVILPLALISFRHRYKIAVQIIFHVVNGLGIVCSLVYTSQIPDLYQENIHKPFSWTISATLVIWTMLSWLHTKAKASHPHEKDHATSESSAALYCLANTSDFSLNHSAFNSSITEHGETSAPSSYLDGSILLPHGLISLLQVTKTSISILALPLGFASIMTGIVTYSGIFRGDHVYSGAAHFIKGGIFFFYGLLTLGRWMGAFLDLGWAWDCSATRVKRPGEWFHRMPSAEMVESTVIAVYGASNVFLEHLSGGDWKPSDFEHLSITILFFGGGLLGMLIECDILPKHGEMSTQRSCACENFTTSLQDAFLASDEAEKSSTSASKVETSANPMPALVILVLGAVMSSHKQSSAVATMMHAQWGPLFGGFAIARLISYTMLVLKPPTAAHGGRLPSELIAAFCLISEGLLFMASAHDTILVIESSGIEVMAVLTCILGLASIVMAWEIVVYSLGRRLR